MTSKSALEIYKSWEETRRFLGFSVRTQTQHKTKIRVDCKETRVPLRDRERKLNKNGRLLFNGERPPGWRGIYPQATASITDVYTWPLRIFLFHVAYTRVVHNLKSANCTDTPNKWWNCNRKTNMRVLYWLTLEQLTIVSQCDWCWGPIQSFCLGKIIKNEICSPITPRHINMKYIFVELLQYFGIRGECTTRTRNLMNVGVREPYHLRGIYHIMVIKVDTIFFYYPPPPNAIWALPLKGHKFILELSFNTCTNVWLDIWISNCIFSFLYIV